MNKRFWFVVLDLNSPTQTGVMNFGYVSDDENPFNNVCVKEALFKKNPEYRNMSPVIISFHEFANEKDYVDFWKLPE